MPFAGWIIFLLGTGALYAAVKGESVISVFQHSVNPKAFNPKSFLGSAPGGPPATTDGRAVSPDSYVGNAHGGAASAITYAGAQLGKPYEWGATGPNAFDCSGLVMQACKAGGVNLVHHAQSQYLMTSGTSLPIVADNNYPSGSLAFFGSTLVSIGHVGIVIGPNLIIAAPHTGAVVAQFPISGFNGTEKLVAVTNPWQATA